MFVLPALVVLAAAPQLGVLQLATDGTSATRSELYTEHLATRLIERGFKVFTPSDMSALLGLERQKQLLACDDTSCLTELTAALGVGYLVTGQIAHVDGGYRIVIKLLDAAKGTVVLAQSLSTPNENGVFARLDEIAFAIDVKLMGPKAAVPPEPEAAKRNKLALAPMFVGIAAGIAGGALLGVSKVEYDSLYRRGPDALALTDAMSARDSGSLQQTVGLVLVGVGVVALVAGVIWFLVSGAP